MTVNKTTFGELKNGESFTRLNIKWVKVTDFIADDFPWNACTRIDDTINIDWFYFNDKDEVLKWNKE